MCVLRLMRTRRDVKQVQARITLDQRCDEQRIGATINVSKTTGGFDRTAKREQTGVVISGYKNAASIACDGEFAGCHEVHAGRQWKRPGFAVECCCSRLDESEVCCRVWGFKASVLPVLNLGGKLGPCEVCEVERAVSDRRRCDQHTVCGNGIIDGGHELMGPMGGQKWDGRSRLIDQGNAS